MARILVSNIMMLNERARFEVELRDLGHEPVWADVGQFLTEEECLTYAGQVDGWLAGDDRISEKVLTAHLPRLRVISKWGTGLDSIDLDAAARLGVPVLNSPGAFSQAVGECAIGYMLMLFRDLNHIDRAVRSGHWPKPRGISPNGKTMGVVGFGAIGRAIGTMGASLGMQVVFTDPYQPEPVVLQNTTARPLPLLDLCAAADVVILSSSLTPENHHMIGAEALSAIKSTSYLINVARGPLIDENALVKALKDGRLAGAALDVFEIEPLGADNPLRSFENVILGSHNCNNEVEAVEHVHRNTIANLQSVLGEASREPSDA